MKRGAVLKKHRPYQELPFECTYPHCQHRFETEKEMKRHKKYAEDHYYCRPCDVDCISWQELTEHKIKAMKPFIEGEKTPSEETSPTHIVCEFCGQDFKSFGGRKKHREQNHPADQDIKCPGCNFRFVRAGDFIAHLERSRCNALQGRDFRSYINQKFICRQILLGPDFVSTILSSSKLMQATENGLLPRMPDEDEEGGGVPLLDVGDEAHIGDLEALEPERNLQDNGGTLDEEWPRLSPHAPSKTASVTTSMRSMSFISAATATSDTSCMDEISSQTNTITGSVASMPSAWACGNTSKAVSPTARLEARAGNWETIIDNREEEYLDKRENTLLQGRWWEKGASGYDSDIFFNELISKFCCPFRQCSDGIRPAAYDEQWEIENHIRLAHTKLFFTCPSCLKRFQTASALVTHAEASRKCPVQSSGSFQQFMDEISGGFLKAQEMFVPKVYHPSTATVKHNGGQIPDGVMRTKFTSKSPFEH